jgi:hypothetical protein
MAATIIGNSTDLAFGIGSDETGMVVQSISSSASSEALALYQAPTGDGMDALSTKWGPLSAKSALAVL